MFAAIRERLVGAWVKLRQGSLAKLFVFEFVVVLLGVLAAQWVADWARERQAMAAMEDARARADIEMGDARLVAQGWQVLGPCVVEDIDAILRSATGEGSVAADMLQRPRLFSTAVMPVGEETKLRIRARYGDDAAYRYDRVERLSTRLNQQVQRLLDQWGRLSRLDPSLGAVSDADRLAARETAIAIRSHLGTLQSLADGIVNVTDEMDVEAKVLGEQGRLARNCAEFRRYGEMFIDIDALENE